MHSWEAKAVLLLRVKAPFAAFRPLQAGTFRSTTATITPTAAYGLLLNLAAIETRDWTKIAKSSTPMRSGLPTVELAIGRLNPLSSYERATLFQQLHNVPVGKVPPENWERSKGTKPNIKPVRREILLNLDVVLAVRCEDNLQARILAGLAGELNSERYGLPFVGDNNFLLDDIAEWLQPEPVQWYARVGENDDPRRGTCRLTTWIDRTNSSQTKTEVFAPTIEKSSQPPDTAWVQLPKT